MDESTQSEAHLTSAAAFVEGGIQEACDDACSICLEAFSESEPSTVTSCKHEFHLQCILEWCQRSSQCPMCWQPISLKDPTSQELLEAVEQERSFSFNTSRNATIFHHPTLGDFELQHLPVGANDAELEERIIQHLAAAAAMGRARHIARREGHRNRSSAHGRPQFLVFSAHPNSAPAGSVSSSPIQREEGEPAPTATPSSPPTVAEDSSQSNVQLLSVQGDHGSASPSGSNAPSPNQHGNTLNNRGALKRCSQDLGCSQELEKGRGSDHNYPRGSRQATGRRSACLHKERPVRAGFIRATTRPFTIEDGYGLCQQTSRTKEENVKQDLGTLDAKAKAVQVQPRYPKLDISDLTDDYQAVLVSMLKAEEVEQQEEQEPLWRMIS
ncbi:E3 ubiquitin-protein ligase RHF2A-like [Pistacia vera]|uniref:E3 ubiquitin-protein ligase RHF2A-like n=1 Tax=Pistacia vera TaxID=55513 RepID=UPI001263C5BD|nr:E3 ubiquitin-protein ligase RHF2A-like [Pistacia vera]